MKKRALISVSDKTGIQEVSQRLAALGYEIISTGGTYNALKAAGIPVIGISDITGFPECLDGRVKTLHPAVHAGLLAMRGNALHMQQLNELNINTIDIVIVNLYPFKQTVMKEGVGFQEAVENIDIGGPAMVRAAAKNHKYVAVVCNPQWYDRVLAELQANEGALSLATRQQLALEAFAHTGQYDAAISQYLARQFVGSPGSPFPYYLAPWYEKQGGDLRYGENPHQSAALYADLNAHEPGLARAEKVAGQKELSFNNYLDLTAALEAARDFDEPTAIIVKHLNPCGAASAPTLAAAFRDAWSADPISAFGGVIGFNRVVDLETARLIGNAEVLQAEIAPRYREESGDYESTILAAFVEAIIAPGYEPEALELLRQHKNMRVMALPEFAPAGREADWDVKKIPGGLVVQTPDAQSVRRLDLKVATKKQPTDEQLASLLFADKIAKHVKSNAIVLVQGTRLVGCGAGQMSRVDSSQLAARKAGRRAAGSVLASDAMFPARDGLDAAAQTGAVAIIQPGGSIRDAEVIAAADEHGLVMVLTGMRHFWH